MNYEPDNAVAWSAIFNRDEFIRRNIGDIELCRDVAGIFFDHGPEYLLSIRTALEKHDCEAVRQSSHKLKGAAANLSLPKLAETAALIETAARNNRLDDAGNLLPELESRFSLARQTVHEQLTAPLSASGSPHGAPEGIQHHEHTDC